MRLHRRALLGAALGLASPAACARAASEALARPFPLPEGSLGGVLRPLGALEISSAQLGFGGISGAHLGPDLVLTVVSDLARQGTMRLALDAEFRPVGLTRLSEGPLRDGAGAPLPRGHAGDAESLARLPGGGWIMGFERWHRIRAFRRIDGPGTYVEAPPGLEQAPANGGLESLAVLADGRWLALAEELEAGPGLLVGWIGGPGRWQRLLYRPEPGFVPVDAAPLPDGGALVLERAFSFFRGFAGRLTRLPAASLAPGAVLEGEELLRLDRPPLAENWEAVTAVQHQGRLLVAMLTDDNENRLQRNLLLLGELPG